MGDLVRRLREHAQDDDGVSPVNPDGNLCREAANEIERLRVALKRHARANIGRMWAAEMKAAVIPSSFGDEPIARIVTKDRD